MTFRDESERGILPPKSIIGMIHVPPLPGSPFYYGPSAGCNHSLIEEWTMKSLEELALYQAAGIDAVMLENMRDVPYSKPPLATETVGAMFDIAELVRKHTRVPIGIQMLEAANCEAMAVACEAGLDFIRAEGFVYAHIGGAGLIEGSARKILELRRRRGYPEIKVFADVKKKHCAHALTGDLGVGDIVRQSEFFCADGAVITGNFTGKPVNRCDLMEARQAAPNFPLLIGSGITADNLEAYYAYADGFIVGSYFKKDGYWKNKLDPARIKKLIAKRDQLREK